MSRYSPSPEIYYQLVLQEIAELYGFLDRVVDLLKETRATLHDHLITCDQTNGQMSSSPAGTGHGPGDTSPISEENLRIAGDTNGAIRAALRFPSQETRSERDDSL